MNGTLRWENALEILANHTDRVGPRRVRAGGVGERHDADREASRADAGAAAGPIAGDEERRAAAADDSGGPVAGQGTAEGPRPRRSAAVAARRPARGPATGRAHEGRRRAAEARPAHKADAAVAVVRSSAGSEVAVAPTAERPAAVAEGSP